METAVSYLVQLILGAVGGAGTGKMAKQFDLGMIGNLVAGAIGGVGGTWISSLIPGLNSIVHGMPEGGGIQIGSIVGQGITALIGGGLLTAIAGAIKKATMK